MINIWIIWILRKKELITWSHVLVPFPLLFPCRFPLFTSINQNIKPKNPKILEKKGKNKPFCSG